MIVSFSVSNFRSFKEEQTFSMVASKRVGDAHPEHTVAIPGSDERVLRAAVLYGANGAGKSNLLKALQFVWSVALLPSRDLPRRDRFRFAGAAGEPSTFDLQFVAGAKVYRFGFSIDDQRILEEWLVEVGGDHEIVMYERTTDEHGVVTIEWHGLGASSKLKALASVGGRPDQSFLATAHLLIDCSEEPLIDVLRWFHSTLSLFGAGENFGPTAKILDGDIERSEFAGDFLRSAATGLDGVSIERSERPYDGRGLPYYREPHLDDNVSVMEENIGQSVLRRTIYAIHGDMRSPLSEESDGTRRLLELLTCLFPSSRGVKVNFIDEIERSLHPMLVREFVAHFLRSTAQGQLIMTTHDTHLLDLELLRRDEIWFAEKDPRGATHLYSLSDFEPRGSDIQKHYLEGRFGAIPFLGGIDRLIPEEAKAK